MNCPKCNHPDFYQGLTSQACENIKCDLYVKPGEPVSSREAADGSTVWDEGQKGSRPSTASPKDVGPNETQGGTRQAQDSADYDGDKDTDPFAGLDIDWTTVQLKRKRYLTKPVTSICSLNMLLVPYRLWEEANRRQRRAKMMAGGGFVLHTTGPPQAKQVSPNTTLSEVHEREELA